MKTITLAHSDLTGTIYALIGKEKVDITDQAIAEVKAIEKLKQEPCDDCISRAEAMAEIQVNVRRYTLAKEFDGMGQVEWSDYLIPIKDTLDILRKLPSVKQEPKTGHWIERELVGDILKGNRKILICSNCKMGIPNEILGISNFCPNCGCRMSEVNE